MLNNRRGDKGLESGERRTRIEQEVHFEVVDEQREERAVQDLPHRVVAPAPRAVHGPRREEDEERVEHEQHLCDGPVTRVKQRCGRRVTCSDVPDAALFDATDQLGVEVPVRVERRSLQADEEVQDGEELEGVEGRVA